MGVQFDIHHTYSKKKDKKEMIPHIDDLLYLASFQDIDISFNKTTKYCKNMLENLITVHTVYIHSIQY